MLNEINSALKEKIDLEACVYAENEFELKDYGMCRQQTMQDPRRLRWTEAGCRAEEWFKTRSVSTADRCPPRSTAGDSESNKDMH